VIQGLKKARARGHAKADLAPERGEKITLTTARPINEKQDNIFDIIL